MYILKDIDKIQDLCGYFENRVNDFSYFFAHNVSDDELGDLLSKGWRKFGLFYFKDDCPDCLLCIPIRVCVKLFEPNKNQRRVLKKNSGTRVLFKEPEFRDEIFEIYKDHSKVRFNRDENSSLENFLSSFYTKSCNSLQSEYYIEDKLAGVGFIDIANNALSSVYFIYKDEYSKQSLGVFSVLKEIEYAKSLGLDYYYLGYYIKDNHFMAYKNTFKPNEKMNWENMKWEIKD